MPDLPEIVHIDNHDLEIVEYRGHRVISLAMIDTLHQRPKGTAGRTFNKHQKQLIENEDYYRLSASELYAARIAKNPANNGMILLTESGYLMLVKVFRDERAWEIQRALVHQYFRANVQAPRESALAAEVTAALMSVAQSLQALTTVAQQTQLVQSQQAAQLSDLGARVEKIEALQTNGSGFLSIIAYARLKSLRLSSAEMRQAGKDASARCRELSIRPGRVPDERWGRIGTYPEDILDELFRDRSVLDDLLREDT
jgi:hypothetical protein